MPGDSGEPAASTRVLFSAHGAVGAAGPGIPHALYRAETNAKLRARGAARSRRRVVFRSHVIPGRCVSIEPGISRFPDAQLRICGLVLSDHPGMTATTGSR